MTIPSEYQQASVQFDRFMEDARDISGLATTNMAWNMVVGVLHTFRRRLTEEEGLRFADVLPVVVRAIFVAEWRASTPAVPFGSREALTTEVQALRVQHNFAPDSAIASVAAALRKHVDVHAFDGVLTTLPVGAVDYWTP